MCRWYFHLFAWKDNELLIILLVPLHIHQILNFWVAPKLGRSVQQIDLCLGQHIHNNCSNICFKYRKNDLIWTEKWQILKEFPIMAPKLKLTLHKFKSSWTRYIYVNNSYFFFNKWFKKIKNRNLQYWRPSRGRPK